MAVALLIGLWVYNEYSYDTFLPDHLRIYQLPPAIVPSL
jgi:hypothetical protein